MVHEVSQNHRSYVAVKESKTYKMKKVKFLFATALVLYIFIPKYNDLFSNFIEMNKSDSEPMQQDNHTVMFCKRPPDVLILGVKKCGTITLGKFLDHHPNIAATGEVSFFETDKSYAKGWGNYIMKMPAAR